MALDEFIIAEADRLLKIQRDGGGTSLKGKPDADECWAIYLALGKDRSMPKVVEYLKAKGRPTVHANTIKSWSNQHQWGRRLRDHEIKVAVFTDDEIARRRAVEEADDVQNIAQKMRLVSLKALVKCEQAISKIEVTSGQEIKALAEASKLLSGAAEVMDGGVSDRKGMVAGQESAMTLDQRRAHGAKAVDEVIALVRTPGKSGQPDSFAAAVVNGERHGGGA